MQLFNIITQTFLVETKLDANYATYSFLPLNYEASRKDRNVHGGEFLLAFRNTVVAEPLQNLNSNCEIILEKKLTLHETNAYTLHLVIDPQMTTSNPLKLSMTP